MEERRWVRKIIIKFASISNNIKIALEFLEKELKDYQCYMVPELPTLTVAGGGMINIMNMTFE